jgi:predicted dehydrogenase
MNLAIVGCGYVSEFYRKTLGNYPQLSLIGLFDKSEANARRFHQRMPARIYSGLPELLDDREIDIVLNLTNPCSHFEITQACLQAGKHVYSEKPLAMDARTARALVTLAHERDLYLASAPCSMLSETAQTVWKALRENLIGRVRLVYANFDDGMIAPKLTPWQWQNESGVAWPAKDEFEVGCTYEHAGYVLTWLAAFFGPARKMTSFASCLIPDKGIRVVSMAPDFTVGCLEYDGGIVARVTCGLVAPHDKSLSIIGDDGIILVPDVRNEAAPVRVRSIPSQGWRAMLERRVNSLRKLANLPGLREWHAWRTYPMIAQPRGRFVSAEKPVDFCRGPAELANAIREKRGCRLSAELGAHLTELIERLQYPERFKGRNEIESTFDSIEPLPQYI